MTLFFVIMSRTKEMLERVRLTNRFHVAVRLFCNRLQMMSKCGKNKKVASSVSLMFLPYFDVFCDLLLNRRSATRNLFVLYNKEAKVVNGEVMIASVL